jgi:hypothetical protein
MVVLYDRLGNSFRFAPAAWRELLEAATRCGWRPQGTSSPPAQWNLDRTDSERIPWDGNYSRPAGQMVGPEDAESLGRAIESGLTLRSGDQALRDFVAFCRQRGFLISSQEFVAEPRSAGTLIEMPRRSRTKMPIGRAS